MSLDNEAIKYARNGLFFTWDDAKAISNPLKHKLKQRGEDRVITFEMAAEVFFDKNRVEYKEYVRGDETRFDVLGRPSMKHMTVLFVTYTRRKTKEGLDVARIISARRAEAYEESDYYGNENNDW
jgi:uncharacterized DUF497 family protein